MNEYLEELNEQQRAAVEYISGPQLVIAGAGSGKTRVLAYKIVHLLHNGFEPWRLMALTFTNKAAREMQERIEKLVGAEAASKIQMGTFHSIFSRILRRNAQLIGYSPDYTIYDATDSKNLVKSVIKDMGLDEKVYKPATVAGVISMAKNALISPAQYAADSDFARTDKSCNRQRMPEIYQAYVNRCRVANAMDFDDLLYYTNVLLRDNPDVRRHYQEFYKYVLVDEYQDTNFSQHMIVNQLCHESGMLCVVGDDAQSIYSFRGANIKNIIGLKRVYPKLEIFKLERNYRSSQNIINAAGSLIDKNVEQIRKNVYSNNGVGAPIDVVECYSDLEESYIVANRISQLKAESGDGYDDFAILYRTNAQSRVLEESLRKRNIPYRIYGGLSFYQRKEVKDAVCYFRLAVNPNDDESLRRVINYPLRGIGETTVRKVGQKAMEVGVSMWEVVNDPQKYALDVNKGTRAKLENFASIIRDINTMHIEGAMADAVCEKIFSATRMLDQFVNDYAPENISRKQNLDELIGGVKDFVAKKIEEGNDDTATMAEFLSDVSLATDADVIEAEGEGPRVTLMTIHAAKGLEFSNIFVVGVEEGLLPSAMSMSSLSEVEEERRLMYVAITRAKNRCILSFAKSRYLNGETAAPVPSRFLREIEPKYLRLCSGTSLATAPSRPTWLSDNGKRSWRGDDYGQRHTSSRPTWSGSGRITAATHTQSPTSATGTSAPSAGEGDFRTHSRTELSTGMKIEHQKFGKGVITEITKGFDGADKITVNFSNIDVRSLMLKFAKFRILQ